jgi:hypothetical protein
VRGAWPATTDMEDVCQRSSVPQMMDMSEILSDRLRSWGLGSGLIVYKAVRITNWDQILLTK